MNHSTKKSKNGKSLAYTHRHPVSHQRICSEENGHLSRKCRRQHVHRELFFPLMVVSNPQEIGGQSKILLNTNPLNIWLWNFHQLTCQNTCHTPKQTYTKTKLALTRMKRSQHVYHVVQFDCNWRLQTLNTKKESRLKNKVAANYWHTSTKLKHVLEKLPEI